MTDTHTYDILNGQDAFRPDVNLSGLQAADTLYIMKFSIIRGIQENDEFTTALFGKIQDNNYCSLFLTSKEGYSYNATDSQHHHLSYLDANFAAYKSKLGVDGFWISPVDSSRVTLIETRLPLWVRSGNTPISGEPLFVRSE